MINSRMIVLIVLVVAIVFAALAAAGRASSQEVSFDSNLAEFMKRTDSSLLKIVRLQDQPIAAAPKHFDEYSLATSDPELYKYLASVNKAHDRDVGAEIEPQEANMEVIISSGQTRKILQEIGLTALEDQEPEYDVHTENIEVGGQLYALEILIPK